jgi:lipoprotein signal peptidase
LFFLPIARFIFEQKWERNMSLETRLFYLRIALIVTGLTFIFGVYPMIFFWPSGWAWGAEHHSHYLLMIIAIYATLGVFLLIASRNPAQHKSLIWFAVWSSVVHAGVMGAQALSDGAERGHLIGDVPALLLVAIALGALTPGVAEVAPDVARTA